MEENEILSHKENYVKRQLKSLELTTADLKGKRVLELGSGRGELNNHLRKEGIDAVGFEININDIKKNPEGVNIQAEASANFPFKDNYFDHVITHMGPPMLAGIYSGYVEEATEKDWDLFHKELKHTISEIIRVLKPGGKVKIYPLVTQFLANQEFLRNKNLDEVTQKDGQDTYRRAKDESLRLYRDYGFTNAKEVKLKDGDSYLEWEKPL